MLVRGLALGLAACLLLTGLISLVSGLYYAAAKESGKQSDVQRASAASVVAGELRRLSAQAYSARLAAIVEGDRDKVYRHYGRMLREAPSDPYRWAELARALAFSGDFGASFDLAVRQAQTLAPRSPAVHLAMADIRWRYRSQLSDAQSEALYPSFVRTMRYPESRQQFLDRIVRARRQEEFCAQYGADFTGGRWCSKIETQLAECLTPKILSPSRRGWCRRVEALP